MQHNVVSLVEPIPRMNPDTQPDLKLTMPPIPYALGQPFGVHHIMKKEIVLHQYRSVMLPPNICINRLLDVVYSAPSNLDHDVDKAQQWFYQLCRIRCPLFQNMHFSSKLDRYWYDIYKEKGMSYLTRLYTDDFCNEIEKNVTITFSNFHEGQ